jgi:hypothetical protein
MRELGQRKLRLLSRVSVGICRAVDRACCWLVTSFSPVLWVVDVDVAADGRSDGV